MEYIEIREYFNPLSRKKFLVYMIYSQRRVEEKGWDEESCAIWQYTLSLPFFIVVVIIIDLNSAGVLAYYMYSRTTVIQSPPPTRAGLCTS